MTTFLDTCAVISLLNDSDQDHEWYVEEVQKCKLNGPAVICDIVYCEASVGMNTREDLDKAIEAWGIDRVQIPDDALFSAGRAFKKYRTVNHGPKLGVLPDFIIGAAAEIGGAPLMTNNAKDYTGYFAGITFISPPKAAAAATTADAAQSSAVDASS